MRDINVNKELAVIVIPDKVLIHETKMTLKIGKEIGSNIYKRVANDDYHAIAVAVKEDNAEGLYCESDLYNIGTLIKITNIKSMRDFYKIIVEIIERVEIEEFIGEGADYRASYRLIPDIIDLDTENQKEILDNIKYLVSEISQNFKGSKAYVEQVNKFDNITKVIGYVYPYMRLPLAEEQELLETRSLKEKSLKFLDILIEQKESIKFQMEMAVKFNEEMNKNHRANMLKEQLKAIQEELNDSEGIGGKKKDYRELITESAMPDEVKEAAFDEVLKLERLGPHSSEESVIRNYLDLLTTLPWGKSLIKDIDIEAARKLLDKEHYGLEKVKDRIIQHLTVMKLKQNKQGSILLLVGPPGTGSWSSLLFNQWFGFCRNVCWCRCCKSS